MAARSKYETRTVVVAVGGAGVSIHREVRRPSRGWVAGAAVLIPWEDVATVRAALERADSERGAG